MKRIREIILRVGFNEVKAFDDAIKRIANKNQLIELRNDRK